MEAVGEVDPLLFRLRDTARLLGWRRVVWLSPWWAVRRRYVVLARDLRQPLPEAPARDDVRWSVLTEADIDALRTINPTFGETDIRRRWREGQECLLGWMDGVLAYARWDATGSTYLAYLDRTLELPPGDVLSATAFTDPRFRGRGLHAFFHLLALRRARERGSRRSLSVVAWWNTPALRVSRDYAGRQALGTIGYWGFGSFKHYFATGAVTLDAGSSFHLRG
jgi:GNAT superfamily N-acetyltransferase